MDDFDYSPDPDDFSGSLDERWDDWAEQYSGSNPYEWESKEDFYEALHDFDNVDHGPDSDLAHWLEDVGLRDEDWDFDVGDTPESG
jgi:hypothetical protein